VLLPLVVPPGVYQLRVIGITASGGIVGMFSDALGVPGL
jgi:hypothetical protein